MLAVQKLADSLSSVRKLDDEYVAYSDLSLGDCAEESYGCQIVLDHEIEGKERTLPLVTKAEGCDTLDMDVLTFVCVDLKTSMDLK